MSAVTIFRRCSVKKCSSRFQKIRRKIPVPESLFDKTADLRHATLLKKRRWNRCFPVNFEKFLRAPFLTEHIWTRGSSFCIELKILRG